MSTGSSTFERGGDKGPPQSFGQLPQQVGGALCFALPQLVGEGPEGGWGPWPYSSVCPNFPAKS